MSENDLEQLAEELKEIRQRVTTAERIVRQDLRERRRQSARCSDPGCDREPCQWALIRAKGATR